MYPAQLSEKQIETIALEFLKKRYKRNSSNNMAEARSQQTNRRNRKIADGLIAFYQSPKKIFTVSLEVKADINSRDLNLSFDEDKSRVIAYVIASIFYVLIFGFISVYFGPQFLETLWGVASILILTTLYIWVLNGLKKWQLPWTKKIDALKQLKQYPGNECWLAIGYFERSFRNKRLHRLAQTCRKQGVGLLLVDPHRWRKPRIFVTPDFRSSPFAQSFLDKFYLNAKEVKSKITSNRHFPVQFLLWTRGQWKNALKPLIVPVASLMLFLIPAKAYKAQMSGFSSAVQPTERKNTEFKEPVNAASPSTQTDIIDPPCTPPPFRGERFLLIDSMHKSLQEAEQRVTLLKSRQFQAGYFWLPCIQSEKLKAAYCVYIGQLYNKHQKAIHELGAYRFSLLNKGIEEMQEPFVLKARQ